MKLIWFNLNVLIYMSILYLFVIMFKCLGIQNNDPM